MRLILFVLTICISTIVSAQKKVAAVPFEFLYGSNPEKKFATYYFSDGKDEKFSLILKDNHKVSYILFDKNFKVINRIDKNDFAETAFANENPVICGGIADENKFNYIFYDGNNENVKKFYCNIVDFNTKAITIKTLFTKVNAEETDLVTFSYDAVFYYLTAIDASDEINIRMVTPGGTLIEKKIEFPVPSYIKKIPVKLTKYLEAPMFINNENGLTMPQAKYNMKIYLQDNKLMFVTSWTCRPTQVFTINPRDFTTRNQLFNPFPQVMEWSQTSPMIMSTLLDNKLFSLISYQDKFQLSVHDLQTEKLLKTIEINKDFSPDNFSEPVTSASKNGKSYGQTELKKWYKEFKNIFDGDRAIIVRKNSAGYYKLTFGMHRSIPIFTGGGPAFDYTYETVPGNSVHGTTTTRRPVLVHNTASRPPTMHYDAEHYRQIRFRLDLDIATLDIMKGPKKPPVDDSEVRQYLDKITFDKMMPGQFSFNNREYVSYYDRENKQYVIEEVVK